MQSNRSNHGAASSPRHRSTSSGSLVVGKEFDNSFWNDESSGGRDRTKLRDIASKKEKHERPSSYVRAPIKKYTEPLRGLDDNAESRPGRSKDSISHSASYSSLKGRKARSRSRSRKEEEVRPPLVKEDVDREFAKMLDTLEVSPSLRAKLSSLDIAVKASMLRGQATLNLSSLAAAYGDASIGSGTKSRGPIPFLRKSRSQANLSLPVIDQQLQQEESPKSDLRRRSLFGCEDRQEATADSSTNRRFSAAPAFRPRSSAKDLTDRSSDQPASTSSSSIGPSGTSISNATNLKDTPTACAALLRSSTTEALSLPALKRLRVILAAESPSWLGDFVRIGGYEALLLRIADLLNMEWREEQRDDKTLHELLRCLTAIAGTERGKQALATSPPSPFLELVNLLLSEKRPGDISTRKIIVEFLGILTELTLMESPQSVIRDALAVHKSGQLSPMIEAETMASTYATLSSTRCVSSVLATAVQGPAPPALLTLLYLLHNPRSPSNEALVPFVAASHAPRPFKTYLNEVAGTCRDYFWIFCHAGNRFWRVEDVDVAAVAGPKVPGGMTGGVEFEAMAYLTSHIRIINVVARQLAALPQTSAHCAAPSAAHEFHSLLFSSGLERILATLRRSSQVYYTAMHLELAEYMSLAERALFQLPANLYVWLAPLAGTATHSQALGPPQRGGVPFLDTAPPSKGDIPRSPPCKPRAQLPTAPSPSGKGTFVFANPGQPRLERPVDQVASGRWLSRSPPKVIPAQLLSPAASPTMGVAEPSGSIPSSIHPAEPNLSVLPSLATLNDKMSGSMLPPKTSRPGGPRTPHASSQPSSSLPPSPAVSRDMGPSLPARPQDSIVGSAIKQWESRVAESKATVSASGAFTAASGQQATPATAAASSAPVYAIPAFSFGASSRAT